MTIKNASSGSNLSPVHIFEKLLDETVLLWPSPDDLAQANYRDFKCNRHEPSHSCIGIIQQEANADNRYVFDLIQVLYGICIFGDVFDCYRIDRNPTQGRLLDG